MPQKDPYLDDVLLSAAALTAELMGPAKALAEAGELSERWAQDLQQTGAKGSFIHRTIVFAYRLGQRVPNAVWVLVATLKATGKQGIMPKSDAELIERYRELMAVESECEGRENMAQASAAWTHDLEAVKRTAAAEAAVQEEIVAVIQELQRRGLNPYVDQAN